MLRLIIFFTKLVDICQGVRKKSQKCKILLTFVDGQNDRRTPDKSDQKNSNVLKSHERLWQEKCSLLWKNIFGKILKKIHYSIKNTISNTNKAFCKINLSQVKLKKFQKLNGQYFDIAFSHHQTKQSNLTHLKYFCVKHTWIFDAISVSHKLTNKIKSNNSTNNLHRSKVDLCEISVTKFSVLSFLPTFFFLSNLQTLPKRILHTCLYAA